MAASLERTPGAHHGRVDPAKPLARARRDAALEIEVHRVFEANFRVYGVRKFWRRLRRRRGQH